MDTSLQEDKKMMVSAFILERTAKRMKQFFQQELARADVEITIDQWIILQELDREDGQSQLALARSCFKDAPTVTRIIDLLVKKNLLERRADEKDRRRFKIVLTNAGKAKIKEVLPIIRQSRAKAWCCLDEKEMNGLVSSLNKVFENL